MSKIIINGKSDGSLKAYVNGNEVNGVMAGGSKAYTRMETGESPEPELPYLCFTAEQANSTVGMKVTGFMV